MFESVLDQAADFAREHAATSEQRRLFSIAFEDTHLRLAEKGATAEALECVRLPRLVYAAVRGEEGPVLPLTVALTVLYVGMDLWDSVMDDELPPVWQGEPPDSVALAAAALIGGVAPQAMATLDVPASTVVDIQCALARAFTAVAAGQQLDVSLAHNAEVTSETALAAIRGKSGELVALFAQLGAILASAPVAIVEAFTDLGRALGTASQIRSDLYDLFGPRASRDLARGTRSLPLALFVEGSASADQARVAALLERPATEPAALQELRAALREAGVLRVCAVVIESCCDDARRALARTKAGDGHSQPFRLLIDSLSFVGTESVREGGDDDIERDPPACSTRHHG